MSLSRKCLCFVKYLMVVFNIIVWLGGCGLFGVGVWLSFKQAEFSSLPLSFPSLSVANLLLVAGGINMVVGFLGCLGALKEQRCLLFTFFVLLLLLVLTEITLVLLVHFFHDKLDSKAKADLMEGINVYNNEAGLKQSWDNIQRMFKCCGVTSKTDWYDVLNGTLPTSCCPDPNKSCEGWSEPCYDKVKQWLIENISSVQVFGVCIGILEILALVFSMQMYCQIRHAEKNLD